MSKFRYILLIFSLAAISGQAQIFDPATWSFGYEKKGDNSYEIILTATIEEGSHIYSMDIPEGGPIPTTIRFDTLPAYTLEGRAFEVTKPEEILDEAFNIKIKSFSDKAEFRQKINGNESSFTVSGVVNFMACN
ncbi:MAG TPA: protein-disulfide reductase DsbD family protein, partial [Bacteroidales bacterium]|nr:protein-disulfide reductase DsbD family protein [Bacteroidales bacterium]